MLNFIIIIMRRAFWKHLVRVCTSRAFVYLHVEEMTFHHYIENVIDLLKKKVLKFNQL